MPTVGRMLETVRSKVAPWMSRWFEGSPFREDDIIEGLEEEISKLHGRTQIRRRALRRLEDEYQSTMERAADVDESERAAVCQALETVLLDDPSLILQSVGLDEQLGDIPIDDSMQDRIQRAINN